MVPECGAGWFCKRIGEASAATAYLRTWGIVGVAKRLLALETCRMTATATQSPGQKFPRSTRLLEVVSPRNRSCGGSLE